MSQSPIISVAVFSFNAAETIEETLDSVLRQDCGLAHVELLIGDDGSTDNTVAVARNWLERHGQAFNRVKLIAHEVNGGVSKNCGIVWRAASGTWIKSIAADDILLPNCLSANLDFVRQHPGCSVVASRMRWFGDVDRVTPEPSHIPFFGLTAQEQYKALRFKSFNFAPTAFMRKRALADIGYADERYRNIEDWPLWLNFTRRGYRICFNDHVTVKYRVANSISKSSSRIANVPFLLDIIAIHKHETPLASDGLAYRYLRFERGLSLHSKLLISKVCRNKRSAFSRFLEAVALLLRPAELAGVLRRRLGRLSRRTSVRHGELS